MITNIKKKVIVTTSRKLKKLWGAKNNLETDEFWQKESDCIFYCDGSKDVCLTEACKASKEEGRDIEYFLDMMTLYYVRDLTRYYLVWN